MPEICKDCGTPIHWVESEQVWYHDYLIDMVTCRAGEITPAGVTA